MTSAKRAMMMMKMPLHEKLMRLEEHVFPIVLMSNAVREPLKQFRSTVDTASSKCID